jgi:hypothetical protein
MNTTHEPAVVCSAALHRRPPHAHQFVLSLLLLGTSLAVPRTCLHQRSEVMGQELLDLN